MSRLAREFRVLLEVATVLTQANDLDSLLSGVMRALVDNLEKVDAAVLFLHDEKSGELRAKASSGYPRERGMKVHIEAGKSISGEALRSGEARIYSTVQDIKEAEHTVGPDDKDPFREWTKGWGRPDSVVATIPMVVGERKIGVLLLQCFGKEGKRIQDEHLSFLKALAGLIAAAIDRARLQEQAGEAMTLGEANRLKAELISVLAHEMRTPLASIKGYSTALLLEDIVWDPQKQREFLEIIDVECDNLSAIIGDLFESSIIDAGLLQVEKEPVLLSRLAEQAVKDVGRRTKIHRFIVTFPDDFPVVEADPERILQVLHNLLDNAVKYSPDGGLVVVRGEVGQGEVTISVADEGVGIEPEDLNRLFDKYFRVKAGPGRRVPGMGLGLPIAQTIVRNHGGRIWAESQLGKGTTLYFSLPLPEKDWELGGGVGQYNMIL